MDWINNSWVTLLSTSAKAALRNFISLFSLLREGFCCCCCRWLLANLQYNSKSSAAKKNCSLVCILKKKKSVCQHFQNVCCEVHICEYLSTAKIVHSVALLLSRSPFIVPHRASLSGLWGKEWQCFPSLLHRDLNTTFPLQSLHCSYSHAWYPVFFCLGPNKKSW